MPSVLQDQESEAAELQQQLHHASLDKNTLTEELASVKAAVKVCIHYCSSNYMHCLNEQQLRLHCV